MSNPLVDRIINNPLTFVPAKSPDQESSADKHPSYIILSKSKSKDQSPHLLSDQMLPQKKKVQAPKKPQSMAEAIAAYTGKKYMTKKEKKAAKQAQKEKPEVNELSPEPRPSANPTDDDDEGSQYESASEFQTDSSFQGFRDTSDENNGTRSESMSESATPLPEPSAKTSGESLINQGVPQRFGEAEFLDDEGEEYNGNSDEEEGSDEEDDDDEDDDDEEGNNDENEDEVDNDESADGGSDDDDDDNDEDYDNDGKLDMSDSAGSKKQATENGSLKADLLEEAKKTTPPTSPDMDENAVEKKPQSESSTTPSVKSEYSTISQTHHRINEPGIDRGSNGSTRIVKNWTKQYNDKRPLGLLNYGVTCYMNSAIQALLHIPALQHYLMEVLKDKHELNLKSVTHTLAELASKMWGLNHNQKKGSKKFVNPKKIIQRLFDINCMMSEWQQEDSHEYFMSLMSRLQEDSTPRGKKLSLSIIYDIFGGLLLQEVVCQECHTVSKTKQEFYDVSLGLNKKRRSSETEEVPSGRYAIEKSIKDFFSLETIKMDKSDESSGYYCEKCKKRTVATKKSLIERSPETLMVHLKRFKFNGNSSSKVKQPILYLKYLDLAPFTITKESTVYELVAVIVHEGRSILSGHYIAHCLQPNGTWSTYDDEYINPISEKEALSDPSAYCLVYSRLTAKNQKRKMGENESEKKRGGTVKRTKH